jgi:hypothetical protein
MAGVWRQGAATIVAIVASVASCSSSPLSHGSAVDDAGQAGLEGGVSAIDSGRGTEGDASAIDFIPRLAGAICQNLAPCCERAGVPNNPEACNGAVTSFVLNRYPDPRSPIVAYDADAASACLQAASEYVAGCAGSDAFWASPALSACRNVLHGTRALGEACQTQGECNGYGDGNVACNGHCVALLPPTQNPPPEYLHLGDPCQVFENLEICSSDCAPDAYCDGAHCVARHAAGSCTDTCRSACTDVSYCDLVSRECAPKVADGEVCPGSDACANRDSLCLAGRCHPGLLDFCTN